MTVIYNWGHETIIREAEIRHSKAERTLNVVAYHIVSNDISKNSLKAIEITHNREVTAEQAEKVVKAVLNSQNGVVDLRFLGSFI